MPESELREAGCITPQQHTWEACFPNLSSPASQYTAMVGSGWEPLAELLRDHITKNTNCVDRLGEQLCSVQDHLQKISRQINPLVSSTPMLANVDHILRDIQLKTDSHEGDMHDMRNKLVEIGQYVQQQIALATSRTGMSDVTKMMEDMQRQLSSEVVEIAKTLEGFQCSGFSNSPSNNPPRVTMMNVMPSRVVPDNVPDSEESGGAVAVPTNDLSKIEMKLDDLLVLYQKLDRRCSAGNNPVEAQPADLASFHQTTQEVMLLCRCTTGVEFLTARSQLNVVLNALNGVESRRTLQEQQQADSVRYLNELNSVSHATNFLI